MDDDDFDFSDDALDQLPANTLQQLEQDALLSTQLPQKKASLPLESRNGLSTQALVPPVRGQHLAPSPPSSDYGFDDEDVIDLDEQSVPLIQQRVAPAAQQPVPPPRGRQHLAQPQPVIHAPHGQAGVDDSARAQQPAEPSYHSGDNFETVSGKIDGAQEQADAPVEGGINVGELLARVQEVRVGLM